MAVVEYVDKKRQTPPPELELGWNMRAFGGLPENGGQLDQPIDLMKKIRIALNIENVWNMYKRIEPGKFIDWKKRNPDDWKMINDIKELMQNG